MALGDPNGIEPEIAIKAAAHVKDHTATELVLVGDVHVMRDTAERLKLVAPDIVDAPRRPPHRGPVVFAPAGCRSNPIGLQR